MTAAPCRAGPVCLAVTGVGIRLPARHRRTVGTSGTPSPTRGSTYRPVGRGPCAPPSLAWESVSQRGAAALTGRRDAVPYTRFNIPSRRAGPACPAEKCVPGGGTHGSRPTGAYPPKKTTRRPLRGAARFPSMCGTDGGELYSPLLQAGTAGKIHRGRWRTGRPFN